MNKSALLHMVRNVSALSDQDVEELEKLVKNFPYCQTAHLLIAKASYDKGNMLSNQKLRKAAAYATNRQLLKKLIYTTNATIPVSAIESTGYVNNHQLEVAAVQTEVAEPEAVTNINQGEEVKANSNDQVVAVAIQIIDSEDQTQELTQQEEVISEDENNLNSIPEETLISNFLYVPSDTENDSIDQPETETINLVEVSNDYASSTESREEQTISAEEEITLLPTFEPANSLTLSELEEMLQVEKWTSSIIPEEAEYSIESSAAISDTLADKETNKLESSEEIIRYELEVPEDFEESTLDQTLAHFDSYLFKPEKDEFFNSELKPATTEEFIRDVYTSNQIGYWMGSSRLGELLQVKDELTHHTPLQFYPDLILEYSKQNYLTPTDPPKTSPVNRQFEIIDQFLKANPKLKSLSNEKVRTEPQDDLAFKSTKNTKNLASENLANIMVQQGKIKKAIKIYEHLIVKIPEKRAYFAAQIEKLRNPI